MVARVVSLVATSFCFRHESRTRPDQALCFAGYGFDELSHVLPVGFRFNGECSVHFVPIAVYTRVRMTMTQVMQTPIEMDQVPKPAS